MKNLKFIIVALLAAGSIAVTACSNNQKSVKRSNGAANTAGPANDAPIVPGPKPADSIPPAPVKVETPEIADEDRVNLFVEYVGNNDEITIYLFKKNASTGAEEAFVYKGIIPPPTGNAVEYSTLELISPIDNGTAISLASVVRKLGEEALVFRVYQKTDFEGNVFNVNFIEESYVFMFEEVSGNRPTYRYAYTASQAQNIQNIMGLTAPNYFFNHLIPWLENNDHSGFPAQFENSFSHF